MRSREIIPRTFHDCLRFVIQDTDPCPRSFAPLSEPSTILFFPVLLWTDGRMSFSAYRSLNHDVSEYCIDSLVDLFAYLSLTFSNSCAQYLIIVITPRSSCQIFPLWDGKRTDS